MNFDAIARFLDGLTFRQAVWLFPPVFALHILEEAPQFTSWVNRYAWKGFTSADFIRNNLLGMALGVVFCAGIWFFPNRMMVFLFFAGIFGQAVWNTVFHAATTAVWGAYSPGVITAVLLYPPLFYYFSRLAFREGLLTNGSAIASFLMAGALHVAVNAVQVFGVRFGQGS